MKATTTPEAEETAEAKRARLARERKQRQREKERAEGATMYGLRLNAVDAATVQAAGELYSGSREEFLTRALVVGAKFLANSGNRKGGKVRLK